MPRRRSYDQYCAAARALDAVGDRWTLLIVRELLAGPRRYTDLHADLPGVSTDMLAGRLKDMEGAALVTRRRLPPPVSAYVYELTPRGSELLPVLRALAAWGAPALEEPRPTDAVRAHWFAIPLIGALEGVVEGVVQVTLDEGAFHVRVGGEGAASYADGPADAPDAHLRSDSATCRALASGELTLAGALAAGRARLDTTGGAPLSPDAPAAVDAELSGEALPAVNATLSVDGPPAVNAQLSADAPPAVNATLSVDAPLAGAPGAEGRDFVDSLLEPRRP